MINIEIIRIAIFSLNSLVSFVNRHNLESSEERIRVTCNEFFFSNWNNPWLALVYFSMSPTIVTRLRKNNIASQGSAVRPL